MSEYWVSKKKYFCKYCDIYIADDAPSRQQHENGLRHKGNKERFVRGLYKAGEKRKKDLEEEKREMVRIEQAAQAAFSQDVGAGHAKASLTTSISRALTSAVSSSSKKPPPRPSNAFSNYSTAESLGYTDPDLERAHAEAERRQQQGFVGEWQYVEATPAPTSKPVSDSDRLAMGETGVTEGPVEERKKRPAEAVQEDEEHGHRWKLRKKTLNVGLGEIYDPGVIAIKVKPKMEVKEVEGPGTMNPTGILGAEMSGVKVVAAEGPKASSVPQWTAMKWKKAGETVRDGEQMNIAGAVGPDRESASRHAGASQIEERQVKVEVIAKDGLDELSGLGAAVVKEETSIKLEKIGAGPSLSEAAESLSTGSLFKKRRAPAAGGAGSRGRRF